MRRLPTVAAALLLAACGTEGASEAQLLVPQDVEIGWDASFNQRDDGRAVLVPIDVMVFGPAGEPVEGAHIVLTGSSGATLVRADAIVTLGADDPRDGWWDAWRDRYFLFAPGEEPLPAVDLETDATGLARGWAFVDRFAPAEGSAFAPAVVTVSLGDAEESLLLLPR